MRKIPKEFMPVRAHYAAMFFSALRDSFQPAPTAPPDGLPSAERWRKYEYRQKQLHITDARDYIREMSLAHGDEGDGFGTVYGVLQHFGCVNVHIDKFVGTMEKLWTRIDGDPAYGRYLIDDVIRPSLRHGITMIDRADPEYGWEDAA